MKIKNWELKIIFLLLLLPFSASAFAVPEKPTGFVQDYVNVLTSEQVTSLEAKLEAYEKSSTNEIAVVIIQFLDGDTIENVAQEIFTKWGIGKKEKNNGVLFLISIVDRETRIHTGYGVEGDLTDLGTSYIQRDIVAPSFRAGNYYEGINSAVDKMIESLGGADIVPEGYSKNSEDKGFPWDWILIIIFIAFQWVTAVLAKSKSWWGGGVVGGVIALVIWYFFIHSLIAAIPLFIVLVVIGLLFDFIVSRAYEKHKDSGGGNPPWFLGGGGFGKGGSGGGFGGFGGGMSGGGGSSGRW